MRASRGTVLAAALLAVLPASSGAQGIEESLRSLGAENARLYGHPVVSGMGAALNSGFWHTARVHRPLGFDFGVRAMGAWIPRSADTFVPVLPASVEFSGQTYADPYGPAPGVPLASPTALGDGEGIVLQPRGAFRDALLEAGENPRGYEIALPRGFDFPAMPMAVAQLGLGVGYGTEAIVRFLPDIHLHDDVGSVGLFGFGVKHSVDRWLPGPSPFHLAISAGWQRLTVGEYLEARARQVSLVASRDVAFLTVYAAGMLEATTVDVEYTVEGTAGIPGLPAEGETVAFSDEADNSARFTLGTTFNFFALRLNADYSFSEYDVLTVHLLVSWR